MEQLASVRAERDTLLLEKEASSRELTEELSSRVASVSQERDQLHETLEALKEEKRQLQAELENRMETVCNQIQSAVLQQPKFPQN